MAEGRRTGSRGLVTLRRSAQHLPDWLSVVILAPFALLLGLLATTNAELAVLALVVAIFLACVAIRPAIIAVAAFGLVFIVKRLGPGGAISYTDALVAASCVLALPALVGTQQLRRLSMVSRMLALYFTLLLPSVLINQSIKADLEWLHRLVLVGGSLVVGAWLVRERLILPAYRFLLAVAVVFSALAIETSISTGFQPAYPLGYHKNFVGSICATALLALVGASESFRLRSFVRFPALALLALGLMATQSRGAMLGAALGIVILVARRGTGLKPAWRLSVAVLAIGMGTFAYFTVNDQVADANFSTNSLGTRVRVETRTREIWRTSPLIGVGLRYYNTGNWGPYGAASNNALNNELAEAGLVGAAGFTLFHLGLFTVLWRRGPGAAFALAAVAGRFLHGQVDIYWSAGTSSLPMMLAGVALASTPAPMEKDAGRDTAVERTSGDGQLPEELLSAGEDRAPA